MRNPRILRAAGISVPFQDVVIATVAIANGVELWTRDQQFALIQQVLPALPVDHWYKIVEGQSTTNIQPWEVKR